MLLNAELESNIIANIDQDEWIELTKEMVAIGQPNSTNPLDPDVPAGEEEAIALFVAGKLEAMGFSVSKYYSQPKRPNIVGVLKGTGGPSLMINDHLDTYPAVETERWDKCNGDPFNATVHGDWIYGRGTSDTRANLAASLLAVKAVLASGVQLKGDLVCCYTVDEEKDGYHGSIFITKTIGIKTDYAITVEPTAWGKDADDWGLNLSVANSGHCLISVVLTGVKSHIWRPDTGVNAISMAAKVIPAINAMAFTHQPTEFPGHTPPCACVVRIQGGLVGEMQFTPDSCELSLAVVGMVPGMTLAGIIDDISSVIANQLADETEVGFTVQQIPGSLFVEATDAVPIDQEPNASIRQAYAQVLGGEPIPNRKNAFNDTIRFREAGINAITFGPGEDGWAPINECISIKKSMAAIKILALAIPNILGYEDA